MLKFICYPKCTTCQKAQKWLDGLGKEYVVRAQLYIPSACKLTGEDIRK